jgi:hypothetical protein
VRFKLGTAIEGVEGLEAGLISLAPGVTLGSLQQFQLPDHSDESVQGSSQSSMEQASSDVDEDELIGSASISIDEDIDDKEFSDSEEVSPGKRKTRSEADKVSLELRGLGVKDGRAARQLVSSDARPSRFGKHQKRAKN